MEYKYIQKTTALRSQNNIKAHKILDIQDKHLIFQIWLNSDERDRMPVSFPEEYETGEYIDLQIFKTGGASYQVTLIGKTPKAFIPDDGRNIAV